ncbi:hypothetical protein XI09_08995 [Bradyrhizobium sp. CCBAU 11386]|nr:hypothetical protein [Bradyrhizobium sp. CCBAU 11386]
MPTPTNAVNFLSLAPEYDRMFKSVSLTGGNQKVDGIVDKILEGKARYSDIEGKTGIPWFVVGVLHYVATGNNFETHLHNDDPLTALTVHVPVGRPITGKPPFTWEESAMDALQLEGVTQNQDWSISRILFVLERWNGFGYRRNQINSPFLWSCTSYYTTGYFVSDGAFDPGSIAKQCGGAALLKRLVDRQLITLK